ncbi:MAG: sulfatase [Halanaerobiales bacterium]
MRTVMVLLDSMNRHFLNIYGNNWVKTPNIDRLAQDSVIFDNHWLGSAPCMPARRDIFTGRLNFLERNWGPIEPFDITLQHKLRENGIFTHITTDHTHYAEPGGENYMQQFNTWEIIRGQEFDTWGSKVNPPELPDDYFGKAGVQYELNREHFKEEKDYPTPKTMVSACDWVNNNAGADNFFLMVEGFDPHEPFDSPEEYLELYEDDYDGPRYEWSGYEKVEEESPATQHLRKKYAATLTMADHWLGKLIDSLQENEMWEDTLFILTTDHGHLLGEHGWTGKNKMHVYNELAHLPLLISLPGNKRAGERINALTQNIDIMPTLLDYYNIEKPEPVQGYSLKGVLEGQIKEQEHRDTALYGWHGKTVNITDGKYTYFRAPAREDNYPCYVYGAIPTTLWTFMGKGKEKEIEMGRFLEHTDYPVYKIPMAKKGVKSKAIENVKETLLFDIKNDYNQEKPLNDKQIEEKMIKKLKKAMNKAQSPQEQFERLGLKD